MSKQNEIWRRLSEAEKTRRLAEARKQAGSKPRACCDPKGGTGCCQR